MTAAAIPSVSSARPTTGRAAVHGLLLAGPAILFLSLLMVAPLFVVFGLSFTNYNLGALDVSFVGLGNYLQIAGDSRALGAIGHTLVYVGIVVPLAVLLG